MTARIAFYAPLKPPGHASPSGDRRFARLLIRALRQAGYEVDIASTLRSRNRDGDSHRQNQIEARAVATRSRLMARYEQTAPQLWFTYHNYYKAPDLLGPAISQALGIPYVLAEASSAPERRTGAWERGQALAETAIRQADLILQPNPKDRPGIDLLGKADQQVDLPPFLERRAIKTSRGKLRQYWAARLNLEIDRPWLLATGMMREDSKRDSFLMLAEMMPHLSGRSFSMILVGDGPARAEIEAAFGNTPNVRFAGQLTQSELRQLNAAGDLFVWPALKEAFGMAPLEAQAAGLPVVIGDRPGIRAMLRAGKTAILTPEGDVPAMAAAVTRLLDDPAQRQAYSAAARAHIAARHDLSGAARLLSRHLTPLLDRVSR